MTDQNPSEMDPAATFRLPAATFRLDQEAAKTEQQTRDDWAWEHHVQSASAVVAQQWAQAKWIAAKASLLTTLDALVWIALVCLAVYGAVQGAMEVW